MKKMRLNEVKVQSFVTNGEISNKNEIKGGGSGNCATGQIACNTQEPYCYPTDQYPCTYAPCSGLWCTAPK